MPPNPPPPVKDQLRDANDGPSEKYYVNFLSGSGGKVVEDGDLVFPYFVASGHSSPGTGASRLSTGKTVGVWGADHWADFPHTVCAYNPFILNDDCTISFEGTNVLTKMWLRNKRYKDRQEGKKDASNSTDWERVGIVVADFPGSGLIKEIIEVNPVAFPPVVHVPIEPTPEGSMAQVDASKSAGFNDTRLLDMLSVDSTDLLPADFDRPFVFVALVNGDLHIRIFDRDGADLGGIRRTDKTESQLVDLPGMTVQEFKDTYVVGHVDPGPDNWRVIYDDAERLEIMDLAAGLAGHTFEVNAQGLQFAFEFDPPAYADVEEDARCVTDSATVWSTDATASRTYLDDRGPNGTAPAVIVCARDTEHTTVRRVPLGVFNVAPSLDAQDGIIDQTGRAVLDGLITDPGDDEFFLLVDWDHTDPVPPERIDLGKGRTVDVEHIYADVADGTSTRDSYTAFVTVQDDEGGKADAFVTFHVDRGVPFVTVDDENDANPTDGVIEVQDEISVVLSGLLGSCAPDAEISLQIVWGDGTTTTHDYPAGTTRYSEMHTYPGTGNMPRVEFTVTTTITCGGDTTTATPAIVRLINRPPLILLADPLPTLENIPVRLPGMIDGVDPDDEFTVAIDWGDGSPAETTTYAPGSKSFEATHTYPDDDPTGTPGDPYTINVTVTDADGGTATDSTTVFVQNQPPGLTAGATVAADGTATISGAIRDLGPLDTFTLIVDCADGTPVEEHTFPAGSTEYSLEHPYALSRVYRVNLSLFDDDGGRSAQTVDVLVKKDAPEITSLTGDTIDEDDTATVSGTFTDPGANDTFTLDIDWADGTTTAHDYPAGTTTFTQTHQYLDDDPTGTPSDDYAVTVTIADNAGDSDTDNTTVTVSNVARTIAATGDTITEGDTATIDATITDPGTEDTFTLTVDWADGTPTETIALPAGTTTHQLTHLYVDDGAYTATLTITDDDTGTATTTAEITVENAPPEITSLTGDTIDENATATVSGTFTDPGANDTFTLDIDWADGTTTTHDYPAGTTTFTQTHQYLDDDPTGTPSDDYTVTIADDDGAEDTGAITATVNNVAPVVAVDDVTDELGNTIDPGVWPVLVHLEISLVGHFTDVGTQDTHTAAVDWGDAAVDLLIPGGGNLSGSHAYGSAGLYTIRLSVTDDDTGQGVATREVEVVDACGAVALLVERLNDMIALPATDADLAAHLQKVTGRLVGENGGRAQNGTCDHVDHGNINPALVKLRQAVDLLSEAEAVDLQFDATQSAALLGLAAKSLTLDLILQAEAVATRPHHQARIAEAWDAIEAADAFLGEGEYVEATEQYRVAVRAVQGLARRQR